MHGDDKNKYVEVDYPNDYYASSKVLNNPYSYNFGRNRNNNRYDYTKMYHFINKEYFRKK